jgi:hypothetical protein
LRIVPDEPPLTMSGTHADGDLIPCLHEGYVGDDGECPTDMVAQDGSVKGKGCHSFEGNESRLICIGGDQIPDGGCLDRLPLQELL